MNVSVPGRRALSTLRAAALLLLVATSALPAPALGAQQETEDDLLFLEELQKDFRRGGSHGAQRDLADYLLDFPRSVAARRLAAEVALDRGDLQGAEEHLAAMQPADAGLQGRLLLRTGRYEDALELVGAGALAPMAATRLEVAALDGLGRRRDAQRRAREATASIDTSDMDGHELADLGWLLLFQRRFELAAQALVFADRELNGPKGPGYRVSDPTVLVLLGEVYQAARQSGQGGGDRTLATLADVLAVDPGHPDALVVKARAFDYGHNGQAAEAALDLALSRDPTHPGALFERGRMRLLARRIEPALEAAERVLAVDPRQREALALRAAALAVTRRSDEAGRARERFEDSHPQSSTLELLLGKVLQSHYRFAESVAPLERALVLEPDDEQPLAVLAQSLLHLGREAEARAALEEHLRRSPYSYPWRQNMLGLLEKVRAFPEVVTAEGFRLRLPPGEQDVLGVLLGEALAEAREQLAVRWGPPPEGEVRVEVFDRHADFSVRTVGFEGFGALGACFGNVMTMLSPQSEMRGHYHWLSTAVHEYAHVVTLGLSRQRVPRWLSEGVSVLEEKLNDPRWARPLERDVLDARANDQLFGVERMDEAFQDMRTIALGYYLGSLVAEVVVEDFGHEALREFVAAFADGRTTAEAVRGALGIGPDELDARVRRHIDEVVAARAVVRPRYNEHGKEALRRRVREGDRDALVPLAFAYHDLGQRVDRDAAIQRAEETLGVTPELLHLLALRDLESGRQAAAKERLLAWAASDAVDADGLLLLARLQLGGGERDAALANLQRARELFPRDASPDGALALLLSELDRESEHAAWRSALEDFCTWDEATLSRRLELVEDATERGETDVALHWLHDALSIEPYDPQLRLDLAELLVEQGDLQGARRQWTLILGMRPGHLGGTGGLSGPIADLLAEDLGDAQAEARERLAATANG